MTAGPGVEVRHGLAVPDPFRALEDDDDPDRLAWSRDRTAAARAYLDGLPDRDRWAAAVRAASAAGRGWAPAVRGPLAFHLRQGPADAYPGLVVRPRDGSGPERVLVDLAAPGRPTRLTAWSASPDGRWLAWQVCHDGAETGHLRVLDVASGRPLPVRVPALRAPVVAWTATGLLCARPEEAPDGPRGLLDVPLDGGPHRLLWDVPDMTGPRFVVPALSPDGEWLVLVVRHGADRRNALWLARTGEVPRRLLPAGAATATPRFGPDGRLYLLTDLGAGTGRVCRVDPARPEPEHWTEVVPATGAVLRTVALAGSWAVVVRAEGGRSEVSAVPLDDGGPALPVPLPGAGAVSGLTADPGGAPEAWFEYVDPVTPRTVLALAVSPTGVTVRPWHRPAFATPLPPVRWQVVRYRAGDGTGVDLTVVERTDRRGPARTVLTAYGGFGVSMTPAFRPDLLSWVVEGGVYAVAHVRGGGDRGADWHRAGRGRDKVRAVTDLADAARHLVAGGWTTPSRLAYAGTSNGGLVAAAAALRHPELVRACLLSAPVTDLVRYRELGDGAGWAAEYGDPDDPEDFRALLALSPYHAVRPGRRYPAFLIDAGSADGRVPAAHARKLCAALQAAAADRPVLLEELDRVGHGPRARAELAAKVVDQWAFLSTQLEQ